MLDTHFALLRAAIAANDGQVVSTEGDAVFAVFRTARQAIAAACDAQRELAEHEWPDERSVKVRMGIHVGEAVFGGTDYTGLDVHRTARVAAAAWGGQVLASQAVEALVGDAPGGGVTMLDLGLHTLRDITEPERLYQVCAPGLALEFPPPRTPPSATRTNLPEPMTRFVGRARELLEVRQMLEDARLVTLTGPGGTGKTRLAIETARRLLVDYPDGIWFVALETVREPDLVLPTIAQVAGVPEDPARPPDAALTAYLAGQHVLLVLDNFEQVISAAPKLTALLAAAPSARIMASSREPLGVAGERVYPVPTLSLPDEPGLPRAADLAGSESVELFVERARAVRPSFTLDDDNAPAVAAICRRLDGLPLAIELAAARTNLLPPAQILDRLDHRLGLVASARRDLPERQRTLRGAIDWSYDLLDEPERGAFRRLSVFAGGADLDAVTAVIDPSGELAVDTLDVLAALVDRSLMRSLQDGAQARFSMLETIREYAAEKLAEAVEEEEIRSRHAAWFGRLAAESANVLISPNRNAILDRLDLEMPNFRAALAWALAGGDLELGCRTAVGLKDYWRTRGHLAEGLNVMQALYQRTSDSPPNAERAVFLGAIAELANWHADYALGQTLSEELIAMLEGLGDEAGVGKAWASIGWANIIGNPQVARDAFVRSVEASRATGDDWWLMASLQGLSLALLRLGPLDEARSAALEAIEFGNHVGDDYTNAMNYMTLGAIELRSGDVTSGADHFAEALRRSAAAEAIMGISIALDGLASVALSLGEAADGIRVAAVAEQLRHQMGGAPTMEMAGGEQPLITARREVDPEVFEQTLREGRAMSTDAAVALGLTIAERIREQASTTP